MMTLAHRAEILKLARVLDTTPERLQFMQKLDPLVIRALREKASASLFDSEQLVFQRIAAASKTLPAALCAVLAERAFGALLCAKLTGLVPPERAVDVAKRLNTSFLADVCLQLDPRTAHDVLTAMPADRIAEVASLLAHRGEFITMGRFVDSISDEAINATAEALDDEALLRIGLFVENDARLSAIMGELPRKRLQGLIREAVKGDPELWQEAVALIHRIDESVRKQMADLAAELEEAELQRMIDATHQQDLWAEMLGIIAVMNPDNQRRLVELSLLQEEAVISGVVRSAETHDLWTQLLPLYQLLKDEGRERLLKIAAEHAPDAVERLRNGKSAPAPTGKKPPRQRR
jgi:hypothetical protein